MRSVSPDELDEIDEARELEVDDVEADAAGRAVVCSEDDEEVDDDDVAADVEEEAAEDVDAAGAEDGEAGAAEDDGEDNMKMFLNCCARCCS